VPTEDSDAPSRGNLRRGDPRASALACLLGVLEEGRSLRDALPAALFRLERKRDKALAQNLILGVLRWYERLSFVLAGLLSRPLRPRHRLIQICLLLGMYQIAYLRVPDHAAVAESVRLVPPELGWERGLVNALLRRFAGSAELLLAAADQRPSARYSHPGWLLKMFETDWPEDWQRMAEANNREPPLWIRANLNRVGSEAFRARLLRAGIDPRPLAGLAGALRIEEERDPTRIPGFAENDFSVQDAAAQHAAVFLGSRAGERVLDACAAPGGKTTHILELAPQAEVLALDIDEQGVSRLRGRLKRMGAACRALQADASNPSDWWDARPFDRILLDAPCSGTDVIRRHPDIKHLRRASDLPRIVRRQHALLEALWGTLAPGGTLLYATCSILKDENCRLVGEFVASRADALPTPVPVPGGAGWGRVSGPGWQVFPGEYDMDGFFFALLRKV